MLQLPVRAADAVFPAVARFAGVLERHQTTVIPVAVMVMSLSIVFQRQIDAAGFTWWSATGRYQFFAWTLILVAGGASLFGRGGGTAAGSAPAPARC